jgi:5-methyltetrahydropteroyltriglutamate--homocysteine methyltransferase
MENKEAPAATGTREKPRAPARAEVVGSLLRPTKLLEMIDGFYEAGHTAMQREERAKDDTELRHVEDELIADAVERQIGCGLDVVTDGEYRRLTFVNGFFDSVGGLAPHVGEPLAFVGDDGSTVEWPGAPTAVDRLTKIDTPVTREVSYLDSITEHPFKVTFPAGSFFLLPMVFVPGVTDKVYRDREEMVDDVIAIERELVADAIAAGCKYIQFDFPVYPHLVDPDWAAGLQHATGFTAEQLLEKSIDVDKRVLEGIPDDVRVGLHLCRGNYRSRWLASGSLEPLAERVFNELPYDAFLVEWDDTARQGDYSSIRFVPEGRTMVMGIINSKSADVETEDDVLRRLETAGEHLDVSQLAISTQCGFASGIVPGVDGGAGNETEEDAQWRKLELVGRVADRVWPR